jgi:hypothetical protein
MRSELLRLLCAFSTLVVNAPSQNVTVPAVMNGVEGGSGSSVPFGSNLACRYQVIYDAAELPWSGPRLINGISIRADNGSPLAAGAAMAAKGFIDYQLRISTTYVNSSTASGTFDDNLGEDVTWVIPGARIQLPAQPAVAVGPRAANIDLMFNTPWFYGLTPARHGQPPPANLLIELRVTAQPSGAYRVDNLGSCIAIASDFGNQGVACAVPVGMGSPTPPTLTTSASMQAGSNFVWTIDHAPANAPFLLAVNSTNGGGLYGQPSFPLPYPMFDPLNPSQPSLALQSLVWSAPDCWLNINPIATFFGICDATGHGTVGTILPAGRQNVGTTFFGQGIISAQTANALQVVTTLGRQSTICGPLGVTRIYGFYNPAGTPAQPMPSVGGVQYGQGFVIEVR